MQRVGAALAAAFLVAAGLACLTVAVAVSGPELVRRVARV